MLGRKAIRSFFGFAADEKAAVWSNWQKAVFFDDAPKINAAVKAAIQDGKFYAEFRITAGSGLRWIVARGEIASTDDSASPVIRGAFYDIALRFSVTPCRSREVWLVPHASREACRVRYAVADD